MLQRYQFTRYHPTSSATGTNFQGEISFVWTVPSNQVYRAPESHLTAKLRVGYKNAANFPTAIPATISLSDAPLYTLFTGGSFYINNQLVSTVSEMPQSGYVHNVLTSSSQQLLNDHSTNPIHIEKRWTDGLPDATQAAVSKKDSLGMNSLDASLQTLTITDRLPLFISEEDLSGNIQCKLTLQVDNQFKNQIFSQTNPITGANLVVTDAANYGTAVTVATLYVTVDELYISNRVFEVSDVPKSIKMTYPYNQLWTSTRSVTGGNNERFVFTLPRAPISVWFGFFDSRSSNDSRHSPTRLICEASKLLTQYTMKYSGNEIPSPRYQLNLNDAASDRSDNGEAFAQFLSNTRSLTSSSAFDVTSWSSNFIGYHAISQPTGDMSNDLDLSLVFSVAPLNSTLIVGAYVAKTVDVDYNDSGIVSSVVVSDDV